MRKTYKIIAKERKTVTTATQCGKPGLQKGRKLQYSDPPGKGTIHLNILSL
jgi:hypothetical protein